MLKMLEYRGKMFYESQFHLFSQDYIWDPKETSGFMGSDLKVGKSVVARIIFENHPEPAKDKDFEILVRKFSDSSEDWNWKVISIDKETHSFTVLFTKPVSIEVRAKT